MTLELLTLKEAAQLLKMSAESLRRKAASGKIPGAKPGRCWCFREDDLAQYLRSLYAESAKASLGVHQRSKTLWHFTNEATFGGLTSATVARDYNKALGLPKK